MIFQRLARLLFGFAAGAAFLPHAFAQLTLTPAEIRFTAGPNLSPPALPARLTNSGTAPVNWNALADAEPGRWLSVSPSSGLISPGQSIDLSLQIFPASFASGIEYAGSLTVSSNAAPGSPARLAVKAEYLMDLAVDRIELLQVVQDAAGDVPLIAGKPGLGRLFLKADPRRAIPVPQVTGTLRLGPWQRQSAPYLSSAPVQTSRLRPADSINFTIPGDWFQPDAVLLEGSARSLAVTREDRLDNNSAFYRVPIETAPREETFRVAYMRVCHLAGGLPLRCPPAGMTANLHARLPAMLPIDPARVEFKQVPGFTFSQPLLPATAHLLQNRLRRWEVLARAAGTAYDQWFAWLPPVANAPLGGGDQKRVSGNGRLGRTSFGQNVLGPEKAGFLLPHMMLRNLGLQHTNLPDSCGASDGSTKWPYLNSSAQEPGFDASTGAIVLGDDLMSHCWLTRPVSAWISPYHYQLLRAGKLNPAAHPAIRAEPAEDPKPDPEAEYVLISGTINGNGAEASFDPLFRASPASHGGFSANGTYCAIFRSEESDTARYCFSPDFLDDGDGTPRDSDSFTIVAPRPPGSVRLALVKDETLLSVIDETGAKPSLRIESPQQGEIWQPGLRKISWTGSHEKSDSLAYAVLLSSDGGTSWVPLAADLYANEFEIDTSQLPAGEIYFQVIVSDGWNQTSESAGPITINHQLQLTASTQRLEFGKVVAGSSAARTIRLSNTGTGPVWVKLTGADSLTVGVPGRDFSIPAGASEDVSVAFSPAAPGPPAPVFTIQSNGGFYDLTVSGKGLLAPEPDASIVQSGMDFGRIQTGRFADSDLLVRNAGPGALRIVTLSLGDPAFLLVSPQLPFEVPPGAEQKFRIRFQPTAGGVRRAVAALNTNDPDRPTLTSILTGEGEARLAPVLQLSTASLDFGDLPSSQKRQLDLRITNAGDAPLDISAIASTHAAFRAVSPAVLTIAPGLTQLLPVEFAPTSAGTQTGLLQFRSNDPARATVAVSLTGRATAIVISQPAISISPGSLVFPQTTSGKTSLLGLTVRNNGNAPLVITAVTSNAPAFRLASPALPLTIVPGTDRVLDIAFTPAATGAFVASLSVRSNDPFVPEQAVVATGTGGSSGPEVLDLRTDDDSFERGYGYPGGDAHFMVRLTPPRYPATLRAVRIHLFAEEGLLPGDTFTVLTAPHPSGDPAIPQIALKPTNARAGATGRWVEVAVPAITIQTGDFFVGFSFGNSVGVLPLSMDTSSGSNGRSYISHDGYSFRRIDDVNGEPKGNFAIRARVELPAP